MCKEKLLVIGSAKSGLGAAKLAYDKGYEVCVFDQKPFEKLNASTQEAIEGLRKRDIDFCLGQEKELALETYSQIVVSPGVPLEMPLVEKALQKGKRVIGEMEFAASYCKAPILAITGTNGKTTTTTLVGEMVKAVNPKTYVVGNIGRAFSEEIPFIDEESVVIAEVSSFQLETIQSFHPSIAALLNITPDHLNRHKTMANYCAVKYRIAENQTNKDYMILNEEDAYYEEAKRSIHTPIVTFSLVHEVLKGAYVKEDGIWENIEGIPHHICQIAELKLLGKHNIENILAAICITRCFGIPAHTITEVLKQFKGVEHRIEYVATKKGVDYYNDSKATNTGAAIPGLLAMKKPIHLIAGGMDKKTSFKEWIKLFKGRVQKVYIIGETKKQMIEECKAEDFYLFESFEGFEEAILAAAAKAKTGECVLLSPACASWDMFESYEQRGEIFKQIVHQLEG